MNTVEFSLRAGQMPPLHVHAEDEELSVLEGRLTVLTGAGELELEAGESRTLPTGVPHTYRGDSRRVRVLAATSVRAPGGYEDFLRAVAEPAELTPEDEANLAVLGGEAGITVLGGPGALPGT